MQIYHREYKKNQHRRKIGVRNKMNTKMNLSNKIPRRLQVYIWIRLFSFESEWSTITSSVRVRGYCLVTYLIYPGLAVAYIEKSIVW